MVFTESSGIRNARQADEWLLVDAAAHWRAKQRERVLGPTSVALWGKKGSFLPWLIWERSISHRNKSMGLRDTLAGVVERCSTLLVAAYGLIMSTPPGRAVQKTHTYQYLVGLVWSGAMVFLQKLSMFHLDHIDFVGGQVKGLTVIVTGPTR